LKALVTGASGFLGSHLVARLVERGDSVRALVRASSDVSYLKKLGVELAVGDVTDFDSLRSACQGVDCVFHAAAMVTDWAPWSDFEAITIRGTENTLRATTEAGVSRFLDVSTDGVYALGGLRGRVTEESPLEERFGRWDYYRRSKVAAERIAREYLESGRIGVSIVRPGVLLGERDRVMLPGLMAFLRSPSAAYLGKGDNRLPYVYVGDVAEACILAATSEKGLGQTYNVASSEEVTQRELFLAVSEATGVPAPRRKMPLRLAYGLAFLMEVASVLAWRRVRPALTRFAINLIALDYQEDSSKAKRELGWKAQVSMREAIKRSVEWLEARPARPVGG